MVSLPDLPNLSDFDTLNLSDLSPLSDADFDLLTEPSFSLDDLNMQETEEFLLDSFALPAPALVSPIKERCVSIASRKRTREETPSQLMRSDSANSDSSGSSVSSSNSSSSNRSTFSGRINASTLTSREGHKLIVKSLNSCRSLKRVKTERRTGAVLYVFP